MKKEYIIRMALVLVIAALVLYFGVRPMFTDDPKNRNWASGKMASEKGKYDVIVVGEEPEGIAAAVSAARMGARTLLLAQGNDLGGSIENSLRIDLEPNLGSNGELLNRGIYAELYNHLDTYFSIDKYIKTVDSMVKAEGNLEVVYNTVVDSSIIENNKIIGVNIAIKGVKKACYGRRFIDATRDGRVLIASGIPYYMGSADLNMKNSFLPAEFNFEVKGVTAAQVEKVVDSSKGKLAVLMAEYQPSNLYIGIRKPDIIYQGENKAIIQGIEIAGVDISDENAVRLAYKNAEREAKNLTAALKAGFQEFKDLEYNRAAEQLYFKESIHFLGEYVLGVNDILENRDFDNKISLGSYPVDASKFAGGGSYIIGKPIQYSIPLGCIIPVKIDNLLMVGSKVSYSSLAASSAGTLGTGVTTGESAGAAAVYSLVMEITPRDLIRQKDAGKLAEFHALLLNQGVYLPDFSIKASNIPDWIYPAIRQLNSLGVIAGGSTNNYGLEGQATQQDLAMLLLSGVLRLSPDKYTLELDARLRPYFNKAKLTREKAAEIIIHGLYGTGLEQGKTYVKACEKGYIDGLMQVRLKDDKPLKIEDVIYLGESSLKAFTGKAIAQ